MFKIYEENGDKDRYKENIFDCGDEGRRVESDGVVAPEGEKKKRSAKSLH